MNVIIGSGSAMCADAQHLHLKDTEVLHVLGARPQTVTFAPRQTSRNRLLISLAEAVPLDVAIRIDRDDLLVLGEVTGCWEETPGTFLAVLELSQYHPVSSGGALTAA